MCTTSMLAISFPRTSLCYLPLKSSNPRNEQSSLTSPALPSSTSSGTNRWRQIPKANGKTSRVELTIKSAKRNPTKNRAINRSRAQWKKNNKDPIISQTMHLCQSPSSANESGVQKMPGRGIT
jgi:hypothetical protein